MRLYPFTFQPIFKERVWGGRNLARLFGKHLPPNAVIGESWEISDRPGDVSVIHNGPLVGKDLRWLVENHWADLLGEAKLVAGRFPLLIKLLDAQERLSLQVHPPARQAAELHGEPKTEMWFIAEAVPGAELYVGLRPGVTRAEFQRRIAEGSVAECIHRVPVKAGDAMFLPSGRLHAIGAGLVIFEIQQNSDTTYRVFDWNRSGLDGRPRELHVEQSLTSIDFGDFAPSLVHDRKIESPNFSSRRLVNDPLFRVEQITMQQHRSTKLPGGIMQVIGVISGEVRVSDSVSSSSGPVLRAGEFCLLPACLAAVELLGEPGAEFLRVEAG